MTQEHPITPPPELVGEWLCDDGYPWDPSANATITITTGRLRNVATQAARWGANQELEACCEWLHAWTQDKHPGGIENLRAARRPKPPSLKEQALLQLDTLNADLAMHGMGCDLSQIRRALESLPS
jgi:hypothetical protein